MSSPTRFTQQSVYAAKDMFIERVEREHTATSKFNTDQLVMVHMPYASVASCCNSDSKLMLCADVPDGVLVNDLVDHLEFENGRSDGRSTILKKILDGPAELEDTVRKILIFLSLAKENHEATLA